jgi:IPT/TIG domain
MTAPNLDSLVPATAPVGTPLTVTILGSGFTATDIVVVEGADAPGTFVDDVSMTFDLPADAVATLTVSVRNDLAEVSNALTFLVEEAEQPPEPEIPPGQGTGGVQPKPEDSLSPNTPAQAAVYLAPEPPDVYRDAPEQVPPESTVTGVPRPHIPEPDELPTTNAYDNGDGGLPSNAQEPYPSGHPRADTWAQMNGGR